MDYHIAIPLASPVTVRTRLNPLRRGNLAPSGPAVDKVFAALQCWLTINPSTRQIWAAIAGFAQPLMVWGPDDFAAVVADLPEQHAERIMQILGSDPATVLQALCDGTALPTPPARVPREIANWRARAILELAGLLPTVEAAIATMDGEAGIVVRNAWTSGAILARRGPTVAALAPALGLTEAQVDAMFLQAESLEV
jgi:hypothetical protein